MSRPHKQYPENFRTKSGFFLSVFSASFVATALGIFMTFLTDYSGIDAALGQAGFAAGFGTIFLLITRIVDAIDDPLQGWLVDSAKECKFGKYRRFGIIGSIVATVGVIMLFAMPEFVKRNGIFIWIWALIGYLLMDMGSAMGSITSPMIQKATTDARIRSKLVSIVRMACVVGAIPATFFFTIVAVLNGADGDLGKTAVKTAVIFAVSTLILTLIGIALLKEPYIERAEGEAEEPIKFKDILDMAKQNKPLWVHSLGFVIGNTAYGLAAGVMLYYLKWYFCADLTTGEVDLVKFAALSGTYSLCALLPNFICPFLTGIVLKIFKTVNRAMAGCMMLETIGYVAIFALDITGILKTVPALFFALFFVIMIPSGMGALLSIMLTVECADYAEYRSGRNMTALCNSLYGLANKAQGAIGGAIPGILLVAVGYSVNAATGAYAGDLANLPSMVTGLTVLVSLAPAALALISSLIYGKLYPITPELRTEMTGELNSRHAALQEKL